MNEQLRPAALSPGTQAAEGLVRRRWTVAEIERMVEAGIIDPDERFELIGGEVVPMASKGIRHETYKNALNLYWARRLPNDVKFAVETTFRMSEDTFVEPDIVFFRSSDGLANLAPATALLAVEVADTSLGWDLGRKALIYAGFGVREVWVIDAKSLTTHVLRHPGLEGYREHLEHADTQELVPAFAPGLAVTLSRLELP